MPSQSKKVTEADKKRREFFQKLLTLCQEYNVNFQTQNLEFYNPKTTTPYATYAWVEVHGAWKVTERALVANEIITPAIEDEYTIKEKA